MRLLPSFLLIASLNLSLSASPLATRQPASGLLYYAKADYAHADNTAVIANPHLIGAFFQVIWSEVEKADGDCDWSELDRWLKPWLEAKRSVAIRVMWVTSGAWPKPYYRTPTPKWVWEKGAKFAFLEATRTEIPLVWDPIYRKYAFRFLEQFAARYGKNPQLLFVDVTPGAETNPYRFGIANPSNLAFKDSYAMFKASDGRAYSENLWLDTVKEWVDASIRIFKPHGTPLLVTLNTGGLHAPDRLITIGDYCASRGVYVGQNGLAGRSYKEPESARMQAFLRWSKETKLFFEMVAATGGRTGTLQEVMEAAVRINCSYLNVYPEDVNRGTHGSKNFDPAYAAALRYGAEKLGPRPPQQ
jgi:hypothetical protein